MNVFVVNSIFLSLSCSRNLGMQFSIPVPITRNGLLKSGIRKGWSTKVKNNFDFDIFSLPCESLIAELGPTGLQALR